MGLQCMVGVEMTFTLKQGDCLELLKGLPDNSIDAVITDPPYGVNLEYNTYIDSEENWLDLMNKAIPEMRRIANFVIFPIGKTSRLDWYVLNHKPDWYVIWYKGASPTRCPIGFNYYELHIVYSNLIGKIHYPDYFKAISGQVDIGVDHPCVKPIKYSLKLVEQYSKKGMTILDPFMGSGTTGVAALRLGRNFIGYEIDPDYFKIAKKRIENESKQTRINLLGIDQ